MTLFGVYSLRGFKNLVSEIHFIGSSLSLVFSKVCFRLCQWIDDFIHHHIIDLKENKSSLSPLLRHPVQSQEITGNNRK